MSRLLERDVALADLHSAYDRVHVTGRGETAVVSGEAGAGKTALVRAFVDGGMVSDVLVGRCDGLRTPRPLGPVVDIAVAAGGSLAKMADGGRPHSDLFAATVEALGAVRRAHVIVVEDVHWADDATLDFLTFFGRRVTETRALLVLTYRDDEVGPYHRLRVTLGDIAASTRSRVRLAPLSIAAVSTLAEGHDVDATALHAATDGNAFFVTESLAAGAIGIPDSVRDAVLARAARLSLAARRLLDAIAIHPGGAVVQVVESIAGSDSDALDECLHGGVVEVLGNQVSLRHELARLAVLEGMSPTRRRGLHRRALEALARSDAGADSSLLAHHASEAGDVEALLVHGPAAAAEAAAAGAHSSAATLLAEVLRHPERLAVVERGHLFVRLGDELTTVNRPEEAVEAYDAALRCWRELGDRLLEGRTLTLRRAPLTAAARQDEATETAYAALEALAPLGETPELADAYTAVASVHMLARELELAVDWSYRAERLADSLGAEEARALARIQGGIAEAMSGDDRGIDRVRSGIAVARRIGDDDAVALGYSQIGSGCGEVRNYAVAVPALEEGLRFSEDREMLGTHTYMSAWLGRCQFEQGAWDDASTLTAALLANLRTTGITRFTALTVVGRLRARRGDPDVWAPLDEALTLATRTGHLQRLWPVAAARAEAGWLAGRLDEEAALLEEVYALASSLDYPWAVGEVGFWSWRARLLERLPQAAADPFRLHVAGRHLDAASAWRTLGCPYEMADALADADDVDSLRQALHSFVALGARPAAAVATQRLRSHGVRVPRGPNRSARANPAGMTDRELDVLVLVAAGLSNAAVAQELGISPKTAGHHVSSILSKLGAANRADAAAKAQHLGITASEGSKT